MIGETGRARRNRDDRACREELTRFGNVRAAASTPSGLAAARKV